jgi:uncharacterized protein involved in response to NO
VTLRIDASMRVDETMRKHPATRAVFDRYGLGGCGGIGGPPETIEFFARMHGRPVEAVLEDQNAALDGPKQPSEAAPPPAPDRLYRLFVRTAIVLFLTGGATAGAVLLGVKTGYAMGWLPPMESWTAHVQAHGHVQIFGWVALFIMGMSFHAVPRFLGTDLKRRELALASFWLMLAGIVLTAYFQPLGAHAWAAHWIIVAAGLEFTAALFFALAIRATVRRSGAAPAVYVRYLSAGAFWFVVGTLATFALAVERLIAGRNLIPPAANEAYLHVLLVGFASMFILGVSHRVLPIFLAWRAPSDGTSKVAWALMNAGVAGAALGHLLERPALTAASIGAEALAAALLLLNLGVFARLIAPASPGRLGLFVRGAYAWFAIAMAMALGAAAAGLWGGASSAFLGAQRHALTVGFITLIVYGMAMKMLPSFEGRELGRPWLVLPIFWLVMAGNATRVGFQVAADVWGGWLSIPMGISGGLEVLSGFLFGAVVWETLRPPETEPPPSENGTIRPEATIGDLVSRHPRLLEVFLKRGFEPLRSAAFRATVARTISLRTACKVHKIDLESLIAELEQAARPDPKGS